MFTKDQFKFDGMYLMYEGPYNGSKTMDEVHPNCHPSWTGKQKPAFVARFKYGTYKPWKSWVNFLVKNVSVEKYLRLAEESSPVTAMRDLGYGGRV
tara:strand:- start:188 stop:475 length:288 start_codon:yes stop_codon:yes gene_type:complete